MDFITDMIRCDVMCMIHQCFWHCRLGDRNDIQLIETRSIYPRGSVLEQVGEETEIVPANRGSPGMTVAVCDMNSNSVGELWLFRFVAEC